MSSIIFSENLVGVLYSLGDLEKYKSASSTEDGLINCYDNTGDTFDYKVIIKVESHT